jgi:hypothetical protein
MIKNSAQPALLQGLFELLEKHRAAFPSGAYVLARGGAGAGREK